VRFSGFVSTNNLSFSLRLWFSSLFFLDEKKDAKKNQGCAKILRFCLVVTAEAKKTRPFTVQMAYALLYTVGLKHFFAFTAFTPAKSGF
jgi:hypothetical protein